MSTPVRPSDRDLRALAGSRPLRLVPWQQDLLRLLAAERHASTGVTTIVTGSATL